jgi:hypothetical protein
MPRMSVAESDRTGKVATGLFQTLSAGNIGQFGASGTKGAEAAPTGAARARETNKARPSASGEAAPRLDEHTAFIGSIFARIDRSGQPAQPHHAQGDHRPLPARPDPALTAGVTRERAPRVTRQA